MNKLVMFIFTCISNIHTGYVYLDKLVELDCAKNKSQVEHNPNGNFKHIRP